MTPQEREVMQMALEALDSDNPDIQLRAATHLRAALAQPEQEIESDRPHAEDDGCPTEKAVLQRFWREHQKQEPVAQVDYNERGNIRWLFGPQVPDKKFLYAAPPQREFIGLTDEEIEDLWGEPVDCMYSGHYNAIRAIEAKLKEKNA